MVREARRCSIANALTVVGERWSLLVLREIFFGQCQFDQIVRNTGTSRDILAARLKTLVSAGVLEKRQYEAHPPRYEYTLTEAGRGLLPILLNLMDWGDRYVTAGEPPTVWQHTCGAQFHPQTVCAHCGEPLSAGDLSPIRLGAVG